MIDAAAARNECEELKPDWSFNCEYWRHELKFAQRATQEVEAKMTSKLRDLQTHYQYQIEAVREEKVALKNRVADAEAQIQKSRHEVKATDAWEFSEFLHVHADITGNWDRLTDLLVAHQENLNVPSAWDTLISITALDKRGGNIQSPKVQAFKGRFSAKAPPTPKTSKASRHLQFSDKPPSSGKQRIQTVQRRPSKPLPGVDSVRRAGEKTVISKETVHTTLPGGVIWKEVRPNLRQTLLAGVAYDKAMERLGSDTAAHGLFWEL
ncbi:hypothetical protein V7S43_018957 [Phytophthora oleae]|uniref:Uncharacterized protein n=1 Tax=Phytophthora oleae TaxID=2107226 RepID=A0ABD3EP61_9STRA